MSQAVRGKPIEELTPYEALLRSFTYAERVSADEHATAVQALERAVEDAPDFSDGWAMLSLLRTDGYIHGFDASGDALERALTAARTAVDKNPANHKAHQSLAWALCFRKEYLAAMAAAERTIALNPYDACAKVYMGQLMVSAGAWERGVALVREALPLNPNHPGWYWYPLYCDCYRRGDYRGALDYALQMNMPGFPLTHVALAAAYGQLGDHAGGSNAIRDLLTLRPDYAIVAEKELGKIGDAPLTAALIEGLRKAGLGPGGVTTGTRAVVEGFWVAVLPFRSTGTNAELPALADALTEEITAGLSRFSYLRVIARGSTLRYATHELDVRTLGKELGASYVMEGTLRHVSNRIRLAVQLVDASTGAQMWAETYERALDPVAIFEIQDDLASCVVSTVADQDGVLPQSMAEVLRSKREDDLTPQEAMLRSLRYWKTFKSEEHALARRILERAVEAAPSRGDCHALLSHLYSVEYWDLLNPREGSLDRALAAAKRAVDVAPTNNLSHWALALALFFKRDWSGFRIAAQRAIELNRMDGSVVAFMGHLIAYSGEWDRGVAIAEKGSALNPHHGGWHGLLAFYDAYQRRDYQRALDAALRLDMGGHFQEPASRAAAYAQLGRIAEAGAALRVLLTQMPDFPVYGREFYRKLLLPEMVDHVLDGLRKAGLDMGSASEARDYCQ